MSEQLQHILEVATKPNVLVQVLPYEAGAHPGMDNTFYLLEFADAPLPGLVYVEGLAGQIYLEREGDIRRYRETFEHLRSSVSLDPEASMQPIDRVRGKLLQLDITR